MRRLRRALLALTLLATPVHASQVRHLDTRELTLSSSDVLMGRVESVHSYWNPSHSKILTDVTVQVEESLKGAATPTVTVTQLGGTVDGMRVEVEGCPSFTRGEEALLFLWRDSNGRAQVNGLGQGKFEISRDARTGARLVQRSLPGLAVGEARQLRVVPAGRPAPPIALDELIAEIKTTLAEAGR